MVAQVGQEAWLSSEAVVRPFATQHRVPSQGYVLSSVRRKLKPQLVGRPGSEIAALHKAGEVSHSHLCLHTHPHIVCGFARLAVQQLKAWPCGPPCSEFTSRRRRPRCLV